MFAFVFSCRRRHTSSAFLTVFHTCALPRFPGAARRIVRSIALDLALHVCKGAVYHSRSARDAAEVGREIAAGGGQAVALAANLTRESEVAALVPAAEEALGPVTLLVKIGRAHV